MVWEKDSDRVDIGATKKVDRFEAAKERATSRKNYKASPGEYFIPNVELRRGTGDWPTYSEYIEERIEEDRRKNGTMEG